MGELRDAAQLEAGRRRLVPVRDERVEQLQRRARAAHERRAPQRIKNTVLCKQSINTCFKT